MDLVRKILLEIESQDIGPGLKGLKFNEYSKHDVDYHLNLMLEAGLIEGAKHTRGGPHYPLIIPTRLTWTGHDFLDACRDEGIWTKAKEKLKDIGGSATFEIMKMILTQISMKQLGM